MIAATRVLPRERRPARLGWVSFIAIALLLSTRAEAVPTFNRQTGQNCVACHAGGQFPDLTPYGRLFKLTGYTIGERALPFSGMAVASYNKTSSTTSPDPGFDSAATFPKDGNLMFQTASAFIAGKITDKLGAFIQITYANYDSQSPSDSSWAGHTTSDNLDIRYVDRFITPASDLIVGATLNNNPTVQDPWNSAPAWGFNVVPGSSGPAITPLLAGGLAQNVTGHRRLCLLEPAAVRGALVLPDGGRILVVHEPGIQRRAGQPAGPQGAEPVLAASRFPTTGGRTARWWAPSA